MDRRIGAQLYTVRNEMKTLEGFAEGIKKLSGFGYQVVQISGIPLPAADMKRVLDAYGMECAFTHRNFVDFQKDLPESIGQKQTVNSCILLCQCPFIGIETYSDKILRHHPDLQYTPETLP